jgi:hypothetical protein
MRINVDNLDAGVTLDLPEWNLPANIMTDSMNVRYRDGAIEKIGGYQEVFGSLSSTSIWVDTINDGQNAYYLYGNTSAIYATDGTTHAEISSNSYDATLDLSYTGGPYNGFFVVTDGTNDPESWDPGLSNTLEPLPSFPATLSCEVIRPFKQFLVALRCTESGTFNPRLIRWSESALPGTLPSDWDYTDPTNDSGRTELGEDTGLLIDCLPLRDLNLVYKEQSAWGMEYIGGSNVFNFRRIFGQVGMLTQNCARDFTGKHFVVTDHDVVVHDGNEAVSVLNRRMRRNLFNRIDTDNFKRSFVVADYRNREMLFCFVDSGQTWPTMAMAWSWQENKVYLRDLGNPMSAGVTGLLPGAFAATFDTVSGTIGSQTIQFDEQLYNALEQYIVLADAADKKVYQNGAVETFNGNAMSVYAERTCLPLTGDLNSFKRVMRIYPQVIGTAGDTLDIKVGTREALEAPVAYASPETFTIGTDYKVELRISGRVIDVRFEYSGSNPIRIFGYDVEFEQEGYR